MDIDEIARLIELFGRSSLAELDYSDERMRLRLARADTPRHAAAPGRASASSEEHQAPQEQAAIPPLAHQAPALAPTASAEAAAAANGSAASGSISSATGGMHVIAAGLAGTFYRGPSPEAEPYVKEGELVEEGQVLALLEAMKMLNPVEADRAGRVERILVEDATPVGAGAALIAIRPEG